MQYVQNVHGYGNSFSYKSGVVVIFIFHYTVEPLHISMTEKMGRSSKK